MSTGMTSMPPPMPTRPLTTPISKPTPASKVSSIEDIRASRKSTEKGQPPECTKRSVSPVSQIVAMGQIRLLPGRMGRMIRLHRPLRLDISQSVNQSRDTHADNEQKHSLAEMCFLDLVFEP